MFAANLDLKKNVSLFIDIIIVCLFDLFFLGFIFKLILKSVATFCLDEITFSLECKEPNTCCLLSRSSLFG